MGTSAARLEVVAGKAVGMSILVVDELVIGRLAEGAGQLGDDEEISRLHARFTLDSAGACVIEDLGSTNGTFVNGLRISAARTLAEGDTIELGQTTLAVRELPSAEEHAVSTPVTPAFSETAPGRTPEPSVTREVPAPQSLAAEAPAAAAPAADTPAAEAPVVERGSAPPELPPAESSAVPGERAERPSIPMAQTLSLQLEVDFDRRQALIFLEQAPEPVRLVFDAGAWRVLGSRGSGEGGVR